MSLIDQYYPKNEPSSVSLDSQKKKTSLIDQYYPSKSSATPIINIEPTKKNTVLDKIKSVGSSIAQGFGKLAVGVGVEAANLATSTLDFAADFLSGAVKRTIEGKPAIGPTTPDYGSPFDLANKWKSFYENTGAPATEKLKGFTQELRNIDYIQPTKEWKEASIQEKFTSKLPETVLQIGPGIIASLGAFAINPGLGFAVSAGSTADDIKTIAEQNGVDTQKSELLGLGTGLFVGWLDKLVPDEIFSPNQKKEFVGAIAKRVVKTGLKELGTEVAQEDAQLLVEATLRKDLGLDEVVTRNLMAGLGGFLGGAGSQGIVSFTNGIRNGDIANVDVASLDQKKIEEQKGIPKELNNLSKEAGKYQSAKDFADIQGTTENAQIGVISADDITPRDVVDRNSAEYKTLKEDIAKNGIQEPVILTVEKDGSLKTYEGSHRVSIAQELGQSVPVIVPKGGVEGLKTISEFYDQSKTQGAEQTALKPTTEPQKVMSTDELIKIVDGGGFREQEQIDALRKSIQEFGITYPVELIVKEDGTIEINDGNHRVQIAKDLGIKEIPIEVVRDESKKENIIYHGTQAKDIIGKPNITKGKMGEAFYLTNDKNKALSFGKEKVISDNVTSASGKIIKRTVREPNAYLNANVFSFDKSKLNIATVKDDQEFFDMIPSGEAKDARDAFMLMGYDGVFNKSTGTYAIYDTSKLEKIPISAKSEAEAVSKPMTAKEARQFKGEANKELRDYYKKADQEKFQQAQYEVFAELEVAQAGTRTFNYNVDGQGGTPVVVSTKSTFPDWIPEELRTRKLIDSVMKEIYDPTTMVFPPNSQPRKQDLYSAILDEIDSRAGLDSSDIVSRIKDKYGKQEIAKSSNQSATGSERAGGAKEKQTVIEKSDKKVVKVPESQLPVSTEEGKQKISRLEARMKQSLGKTTQDEIDKLGLTTYTEINNEDNVAKAAEYVANNPTEAIRVIKGEIEPPKGVLRNAVYVALKNLGSQDTELATKIASLNATRIGQELSVLQELDKDNPVTMMEDIVNIRIEAYEKKTGKKVKERIKKEMAKIDEETKAPSGRTWDQFLETLAC